MPKEVNVTLSIYKDKGLWGYCLPELGLNFTCKSRNQAIKRAASRIVQILTGPEDDETRAPQNEDPDLYGKYGDGIYNRAAGQERGE